MIPMVKIKNYKLRSSGKARNQIVQIPIAVIREWDLREGDEVEMFKTLEGALIIKPKGMMLG